MVVSTLSCDALERSNDPYTESILEPCVSKNQKEIFAMWIWLGRKFWERAEAVWKSIPELKMEFVYLCAGEKKIAALKLL